MESDKYDINEVEEIKLIEEFRQVADAISGNQFTHVKNLVYEPLEKIRVSMEELKKLTRREIETIKRDFEALKREILLEQNLNKIKSWKLSIFLYIICGFNLVFVGLIIYFLNFR